MTDATNESQRAGSLVQQVANAGPPQPRNDASRGMGYTASNRHGGLQPILDDRKQWLMNRGYDDRGGNLEQLALYMTCYRYAELGEGNCPRGLMLIGGTGRGKTFAMQIFGRWARIPIVPATQVVAEYFRDKDGTMERYTTAKPYRINGVSVPDDLILDDLGTEIGMTDYGRSGLDVITRIIDARYRLWQRSGARLHLTTNLSPERIRDTDGILERYGRRTLSRLQEMCEINVFGGADRRTEPREETKR